MFNPNEQLLGGLPDAGDPSNGPCNADSCLLYLRPSMTGGEEGFQLPGQEKKDDVRS